MKKILRILLVFPFLISCSDAKQESKSHSGEISQTTTDVKPEGVHFSGDDQEFFERLTWGGYSVKEAHRKLRDDIHQCMRERGWEFESKLPVRPESDANFNKPPAPPQADSGYGYSNKNLQKFSSTSTRNAPFEDVNTAAFQAAYGSDFSETLRGSDRNKFNADLRSAGNGCIVIAEAKLFANTDVSNAYIDRVFEKMTKAIRADKDLDNAAKLWSTCMKENAHDFPDREKLRESLGSKALEILQGDPAGVESQLMVLLEEEKRVATVDLKCSEDTSYDVVMQEIYKKYGLIAAEELGYLR
jgi:hypothetical protein